MPHAVRIAGYDPAWPERYEAEAARLRRTLGPVAVRIEHVGSTAVPGLPAKPTIDIQVSVASFEPFEAYGEPLRNLGYEYRPNDEPEHRFFALWGPDRERLVHVHVCEAGGEWERRHLAFRDALRADPDLRARYEAEKLRVAALHPGDSLAYADAKTPWIRAEERRLGIIEPGDEKPGPLGG
ncbi:MAG: GrpB family protein [Actinomycetota bacterium]